jgi:methionyl-tRNA formyltransferase
MLKCALVGSRYFGATVLEALRREPGVEFTGVVAPAADDRLALAAQAAGLPLHVMTNPKIVPGEAIAEGTDLIVAAHTHARVSNEALARSRLGGVGYHPSLLPRHRGIAAVEWTILEGDAIAGGSVYHLADGWDAGAVAAQDWCFVLKGEDARGLWERALAPMGLSLLARVVGHARDHGALPAHTQDPRFASKAPMLKKAVVLKGEPPPQHVSLVATVMGADRPGIVSLLADRAMRHGANWTSSQMANLAGEFAGMVHFDVPRDRADALAAALRGLESTGLQVVVARTEAGATTSGPRLMQLQLVGEDRVGLVSQLASQLAARGVSIQTLHTELAAASAGPGTFRITAQVLVPMSVPADTLRQELGALAQQMMLDIALDEAAGGE